MIEGPIGGAAFNNEFGRPNICGYFRTFEQAAHGDPATARARLSQAHHDRRRPRQRAPQARREGRDPGRREARRARRSRDADRSRRRRGVVGGQRRVAAPISISRPCSAATRRSSAARRKSSTAAGALGDGQSDPADPRRRRGRLVERGARSGGAQPAAARVIDLRAIPNDEPGMSPMEIWCNEAQERYVLIVDAAQARRFAAIARRERCPFAVVGEIDDTGVLRARRPAVRQHARSTCRSKCCSASRRRCCATCAA